MLRLALWGLLIATTTGILVVVVFMLAKAITAVLVVIAVAVAVWVLFSALFRAIGRG